MLRWSWRCLDYTGSSVYREFLVKYQWIPTAAVDRDTIYYGEGELAEVARQHSVFPLPYPKLQARYLFFDFKALERIECCLLPSVSDRSLYYLLTFF
jgi:hypothetical protein